MLSHAVAEEEMQARNFVTQTFKDLHLIEPTTAGATLTESEL